MSSLVPFTFNNTNLFIVTINGKSWTRAKEVCNGLEYDKNASKTANIVRGHCSPENTVHKYQLSGLHDLCTPVKWPSDSQKFDLYINEEAMYELMCWSEQPKARAFRKYCCNELFPEIQNRQQNLVIKEIEERHQLAIEERDSTIAEHDAEFALVSDDLAMEQNHARQLEYSNTGLQGEIHAKDQQIAMLQQRCVPYLKDDKKNYGMTGIAKNDASAEIPFISICGQHGYRRQKKQAVLLKNPGNTEFSDGETPNAIVTYNFWQKHKLIETDPHRPRDFRLVEGSRYVASAARLVL